MKADTDIERKSTARPWRGDALAIVSVTLALLTCYGTLAVTALLSLLGIRLALDQALWSGAIVLFTVLTVIAVVAGMRVHRAFMPTVTAIAGAALVFHALLVDYHVVTELAGFALLAIAVVRDARRRRTARRKDAPVHRPQDAGG